MGLLQAHVRPTSVVIDVGAGIGLYSYGFAKHWKAVEAFEPNPTSANLLRQARIPGVRVHEQALSSHSGRASLHIPVDDGGEHSASGSLQRHPGPEHNADVELRRLDDFGFRDVGLIKIDVEGHEAEVVEGGTETLQRERPALWVEIEQRHLGRPMREVVSEIESHGYRGLYLRGTRLVSLADFDVKRDQTRHLPNVLHADYINNFLFLPA